MTFVIQQLLTLPHLTSARRLLALQRMSARAALRTDCVPLMGPLGKASKVQEKALAVADQWRKADGDRALHADGAKSLDGAVDRMVTGLHAVLENIARSFGPDEVKLAQKLLEEVFPNGAGELVSLPYVEEHGAVVTILNRLQTDLAANVKGLELESWVRRLAKLVDDYGLALTRPERLTWDDVVAADNAGHEALAEVVARILGLFPTNTPADVAARTELLGPVADQQEEITKLRASRKHPDGTSSDDDLVEEPEEGSEESEEEPEAEAVAEPETEPEAVPAAS